MKIDIIAGTRPNYVKVGALFSALKRIKSKHQFRFINTGQHYDKAMTDFFFKSFSLPKPYFNMIISKKNSNKFTEIFDTYYAHVKKDPPKLCVVVGDVTSTIACALAAKYNNIKIVHIEAGLRSNDFSMPEEINRKITDSITDIFFTTTIQASQNLINENIKKNVYLVGNVMIDSLKNKLSEIKNLKSQFYLNEYLVITMHRQANVRNILILIKFLDAFINLAKIYDLIYVAHPFVFDKIKNSKEILSKFNIKKIINKKNYEYLELRSNKDKIKKIKVVSSLSYENFLSLIMRAKGVLTDSGGLTEETSFLNIPTITFRNNTERPETVKKGTNILIGDDFNKLENLVKKIKLNKWKQSKKIPFWDGKTSDRIIQIINKLDG